MENQESFDVEAFVDEGLAASGQQAPAENQTFEQVQTESDNQADEHYEPDGGYGSDDDYARDTDYRMQDGSDDDLKEILEEDESTMDLPADDSQDETLGGRVPLEQHIKLRRRAQQAEARARAAERQLKGQTRTDGGYSGVSDPLAEFKDDDLVRAGHVRQALSNAVESAVLKANRQLQEQRQIEQTAAWAVESEQYVRSVNPDYDRVTDAANKLGLISDEERLAIFSDKNPAQKFYELSRHKVRQIQQMLGMRADTSNKTTYDEIGEETEDDEPITDDLFDEIFDR